MNKLDRQKTTYVAGDSTEIPLSVKYPLRIVTITAVEGQTYTIPALDFRPYTVFIGVGTLTTSWTIRPPTTASFDAVWNPPQGSQFTIWYINRTGLASGSATIGGNTGGVGMRLVGTPATSTWGPTLQRSQLWFKERNGRYWVSDGNLLY